MIQKQVITTQEDLATIIAQAMKADAVGLDTEFVWERTYFPKLGLIQIALNDEQCYAIDPLAIKDLTPLGELLTSKETIKIFHDAQQDLAILKHACNDIIPQNIFDTRLAAGFAGSISTISLEKLVKEQLNTVLDKGATRTDWTKRPLTDTQLAYCLNDVRYLRAIRILLLERITGPKVRSWLEEELTKLNDPINYEMIADKFRYSKIKGIYKLPHKSIALGKTLCIWREETARKFNKPRGHILKDEIVMDICNKQPLNIENLKETEISSKALNKYGIEILKICQTNSRDDSPLPKLPTGEQLTTAEKTKLKELKGLITLKSDILGIDPALIGNTKELKKLVKFLNNDNLTTGRQGKGWRKEFLTEFVQFHRAI